jgi:hypothetical protein
MEAVYERVYFGNNETKRPGFVSFPLRRPVYNEAVGRSKLMEIRTTKIIRQFNQSQYTRVQKQMPASYFKIPKKYTRSELDLINSVQPGGTVPRVVGKTDGALDDKAFGAHGNPSYLRSVLNPAEMRRYESLSPEEQAKFEVLYTELENKKKDLKMSEIYVENNRQMNAAREAVLHEERYNQAMADQAAVQAANEARMEGPKSIGSDFDPVSTLKDLIEEGQRALSNTGTVATNKMHGEDFEEPVKPLSQYGNMMTGVVVTRSNEQEMVPEYEGSDKSVSNLFGGMALTRRRANTNTNSTDTSAQMEINNFPAVQRLIYQSKVVPQGERFTYSQMAENPTDSNKLKAYTLIANNYKNLDVAAPEIQLEKHEIYQLIREDLRRMNPSQFMDMNDRRLYSDLSSYLRIEGRKEKIITVNKDTYANTVRSRKPPKTSIGAGPSKPRGKR